MSTELLNPEPEPATAVRRRKSRGDLTPEDWDAVAGSITILHEQLDLLDGRSQSAIDAAAWARAELIYNLKEQTGLSYRKLSQAIGRKGFGKSSLQQMCETWERRGAHSEGKCLCPAETSLTFADLKAITRLGTICYYHQECLVIAQAEGFGMSITTYIERVHRGVPEGIITGELPEGGPGSTPAWQVLMAVSPDPFFGRLLQMEAIQARPFGYYRELMEMRELLEYGDEIQQYMAWLEEMIESGQAGPAEWEMSLLEAVDAGDFRCSVEDANPNLILNSILFEEYLRRRDPPAPF